MSQNVQHLSRINVQMLSVPVESHASHARMRNQVVTNCKLDFAMRKVTWSFNLSCFESHQMSQSV
jgi:hypothetical protein